MHARSRLVSAALGLALFSSSCVLAIKEEGHSDWDREPILHVEQPFDEEESGDTGSESTAAPTNGKDPDLAGLTHSVEIARMELEVARLKADAAERDAESSVHTAEIEVDHARGGLEKSEADGAIKRTETELSLDRARFRLEEQVAELAELEAMYAEEEFAEKTKELVLTRGKRSVEVAKRSLAISEQRLDVLMNLELPASRKKAELALHKAELALEKARSGKERSLLEARIALQKAEHKLREAEKKLAEASKK